MCSMHAISIFFCIFLHHIFEAYGPSMPASSPVHDTGSGYTPWRQSSNASSTATPDGHRLSLSPEAPRPPKRESNAAAEDLPEPAAASGGLPAKHQ